MKQLLPLIAFPIVLMLIAFSSPSGATTGSFIASYKIKVTDGDKEITSTTISFARTPHRVALADTRKQYRDVWGMLLPSDQIMLERVVDIAASVIEFTPGELATREHKVNWSDLQTPFGVDVSGNCEATSPRVTSCKAGDVLPTHVTLSVGSASIDWTLESLSVEPSDVERLTAVDNTFRRWNAADFGDQERDAELRTLLPLADLSLHGRNLYRHGATDEHSEHRH